jgi:hypothetical protein
MKTKRIHAVAPENTIFFDDDHPSGEAKATGTPTIRTSDKATKAKRESWKRNSM